MRKKIPHFNSLEEESDFWDEADLTDYIDPDEPPVNIEYTGPPRMTLSLRFDEEVIERLRAFARRNDKGFQTLMTEWVVERLEQELAREMEAQPKQAVR